MWIALLQVPHVVQIAVGKDYKSAIQRFGVFSRLLLANERIRLLRLGFEYDQREGFLVQEQEIHESVFRRIEIITERSHRFWG